MMTGETQTMYQQTTLDNGLTILAEPTPTARSFAAGLFVRTGSRDEPPAINGVSHFLEHVVAAGEGALGGPFGIVIGGSLGKHLGFSRRRDQLPQFLGWRLGNTADVVASSRGMTEQAQALGQGVSQATKDAVSGRKR